MRNNQKIVELEDILIYFVYQVNQDIYIKSIHLIEDKLMIFYFDGYQLTVVDEYVVNNSRFVRPLQFQHEHEFISIASITNQNKSICSFFVKDFIKLINIKLCHNHNFTFSQDIITYFNLKNQLKLFNLKYINATLKIPEKQITYYDEHLVQLQINFKQNNQLLQLHKTLKILVYNLCYQIYPNQQSIKINEKSQIKLETLFSGPISMIQVKNNKVSQVVSPFKKEENIQNCSSQIMQKCFEIYLILQNSTKDYFQFYYIREFNFYQVQNSLETKLSIIKNGLINNSQYFLNIFTDKEKIYLHFFKIEHESRQLIEINFKIVDEIVLQQPTFEIKFREPLVLIKIKDQMKDKEILIYFQNQDYVIYSIASDQENIDICKISNYQYQRLYHSQDKIFFELFQFVNNKIKTILSFSLSNFEFESILKEISFFYQDFYQKKLFQKTISNCTLFNEVLEINLFLILNQFSSEVKIIYNIQNGEKQYKLLKMIRNPHPSQLVNLQYFDSSFFVLESFEGYHFLYDLRRNQTLFDYFAQFEFNNLFKINTTHYIISTYDNFYVGKIGYEIEFLGDDNHQIERINIVAQNEVSSAELEIEITRAFQNENQQIQSFIQNLVILILALLILICFIRRASLKQKLKNRQWVQTQDKSLDI